MMSSSLVIEVWRNRFICDQTKHTTPNSTQSYSTCRQVFNAPELLLRLTLSAFFSASTSSQLQVVLWLRQMLIEFLGLIYFLTCNRIVLILGDSGRNLELGYPSMHQEQTQFPRFIKGPATNILNGFPRCLDSFVYPDMDGTHFFLDFKLQLLIY